MPLGRVHAENSPNCSVIVFRCTRTLLDRLPDRLVMTPVRSTTALGDWYFKLLFTRPQWLLLGVSERSRLPVVLSARDLDTMHLRFLEASERAFHDLRVSGAAISAELTAMRDAVFSKTIDRRVIGSLNDFAHAVKWALHDRPGEPLAALNLWLAETPILPLKDSPDRMTRRLLEARVVN